MLSKDEWDWDDEHEEEDPSKASVLPESCERDDDEADATKDKEREKEARIADVQRQLRNFQIDIADQAVRERINNTLSLTSFSEFMAYYDDTNQRKLREQTVTADLKRMHYEVILSGSSTTDKDEILQIYHRTCCDNSSSVGDCDALSPELWGLANQSVYAGVLLGLQRGFLKPELCTTLRNSHSEFLLDLDAAVLRSSSLFVLGCDGGAPLQLATFKACVVVDLRGRAVSQTISSPQLTQVFDDELRRAAESIADTTSEYLPDRQSESLRLHVPLLVVANVAEGLVRGLGALVGADQPISFRELAEEAAGERDQQQRRAQQRQNEDMPETATTEEPTAVDALFSWGSGLLSSLGGALAGEGDAQPIRLYRRDEA